MNDARPAPRPRRFAGYDIVTELYSSRGTQRYEAVQLALGRPVVLNVLPIESAKNPTRLAYFERERDVCAALRHENVVGAIEAGEFEGERYFVTELVEGRTLADEIAGGPWDAARAAKLGRDLARALVHLESLHLVHREITPHAVSLADGELARIVDFRRAKFLAPDAAETWSDVTMNVALYMAPEVARGDARADPRADQYSFGCVLYHVLTGRPPFYGRDVGLVLDLIRHRKPRDPRWLAPDLPKGVVHVLDRCLRKPREQRYPRAADLRADLELLAVGREPTSVAPAGTAWERPRNGSSPPSR